MLKEGTAKLQKLEANNKKSQNNLEPPSGGLFLEYK
jgi:hypothetical protein